MNKLILIGASTGGPSQIKKIVQALPTDFKASVVIAQHMSDEFISTFASHLNSVSHLTVQVAQEGEMLEESKVYITSKLCHVEKSGDRLCFKISAADLQTFNPDINELFLSCAKFADSVEIMACILTGIGQDGVEGISALCKMNAVCIAESQESAIVYGMPQRAKEVSNKVQQKSLDEIIVVIKAFGT